VARNRFLTPLSPPSGATVCRPLIIPDGVEYRALIYGALDELSKEFNWEQSPGGISPAQAAQIFADALYQSAIGTCGGRVIGEIVTFAGSGTPDPNWLECDGRSLLRTDYPALFTAIGTTYGAADSNHFNIPDLRGRAPIGHGQGVGLTNRPIGARVGEEAHTLTVAEIPSHNHMYNTTDTPMLLGAGELIDYVGLLPNITQSTGGGQAHNNMQPSLTLTFWIVAK
jgi:microcystin-dependent protein